MGLSKSKADLKGQMSSEQTSSVLTLTDWHGETKVFEIPKKRKSGQTLLQIAVDNSVDLPHSCGGMGTCGTCRVRFSVARGPCPPREQHELEMATERGYAQDERLSCQLEIPNEDFSWSAVALGSPDEE